MHHDKRGEKKSRQTRTEEFCGGNGLFATRTFHPPIFSLPKHRLSVLHLFYQAFDAKVVVNVQRGLTSIQIIGKILR